jgi:WD40 repeat protein
MGAPGGSRGQSVFRDIAGRELRTRLTRRLPRVGHPSFMRGLRLVQTLEKHAGCVNTVAWNEDASLLLSGSDDLSVCVWSTGAGFPCKGSVYTGHSHNIFSAEFVPGSASAQCVTTAGDGDVRLVNLERGLRNPSSRLQPRRGFNPGDEDAAAARSLFAGVSHERGFLGDHGMGMRVGLQQPQPSSWVSDWFYVDHHTAVCHQLAGVLTHTIT